MTTDREKLAETVLADFDLAFDMARRGRALNADHPLTVIQDCFDAALDALAEPCQECDMWETRSDVVVETMERYKTRAEAAESKIAEWENIAPTATPAQALVGDWMEDVPGRDDWDWPPREGGKP